MSKLKNIIKQLSEESYTAIYDSLIRNNAEKSAFLLKAFRDKKISDNKLMEELDVNTNAYYTMRSRVNNKIEDYLIQQVESPRADILKKVANLNEVIFTKKRVIAVTTLKRLEKDLLKYDLASELAIVYKFLKKIYANTSDHFTYSQLYNRHMSYMLAVDKMEDLMGIYFRSCAQHLLSGRNSQQQLTMDTVLQEVQSVNKVYKSHRLYVYRSLIVLYNRIFIDKEQKFPSAYEESTEDIFDHIQKITRTYKLDPVYYHLNIVFTFLKLEYYTSHKIYDQELKYIDEVEESIPSLLTNYGNYTFSSQALISRMQRYLRNNKEMSLYHDNVTLFFGYEPDATSFPAYVVYTVYQAVSHYYVDKYGEAIKLLTTVLNDSEIKQYPAIHTEIKALLALQYCMMNEFDLFIPVINSVQRQLRSMNKSTYLTGTSLLIRIMRLALNESKQNKAKKLTPLVEKFKKNITQDYFSPIAFIRMDEKFIKKMIAVQFIPQYQSM